MAIPTLDDLEQDEDFQASSAPQQDQLRQMYLHKYVLPDEDFKASKPAEKAQIAGRVMAIKAPTSTWENFSFMPQMPKAGPPTQQPDLTGIPSGTEFAPTGRPAPRKAAAPASEEDDYEGRGTSGLSGELGNLKRPGGGFSSELATGVSDPRLNNGRETNIPILVKGQKDVDALLRGERPTREQLDIAIRRAVERGQPLASYDTWQEADAATLARHKKIEEKLAAAQGAPQASPDSQPPATEYILQSQDGRRGKLAITNQGNPVFQPLTNDRTIKKSLMERQGRNIVEPMPNEEFDSLFGPGATEQTRQQFISNRKIPIGTPRPAPARPTPTAMPDRLTPGADFPPQTPEEMLYASAANRQAVSGAEAADRERMQGSALGHVARVIPGAVGAGKAILSQAGIGPPTPDQAQAIEEGRIAPPLGSVSPEDTQRAFATQQPAADLLAMFGARKAPGKGGPLTPYDLTVVDAGRLAKTIDFVRKTTSAEARAAAMGHIESLLGKYGKKVSDFPQGFFDPNPLAIAGETPPVAEPTPPVRTTPGDPGTPMPPVPRPELPPGVPPGEPVAPTIDEPPVPAPVTPAPTGEVPATGQPAPGATVSEPPAGGPYPFSEETYQKVKAHIEAGGRVTLPGLRRDIGLSGEQAGPIFQRLQEEGVIEQVPGVGWRRIEKSVVLPDTYQGFLSNLKDGGIDTADLERVLQVGAKAKVLDGMGDLFARGMSDKEVEKALTGVPEADRPTLVQAVRIALGVPEADDAEAFEAWKQDYLRNKPAESGTPGGDQYQKALEYVKSGSPIRAGEIGKALGGNFSLGNKMLQLLEARGIIEVPPEGGYRLTGSAPPVAPAPPTAPAAGSVGVTPPTAAAPAVPPVEGADEIINAAGGPSPKVVPQSENLDRPWVGVKQGGEDEGREVPPSYSNPTVVEVPPEPGAPASPEPDPIGRPAPNRPRLGIGERKALTLLGWTKAQIDKMDVDRGKEFIASKTGPPRQEDLPKRPVGIDSTVQGDAFIVGKLDKYLLDEMENSAKLAQENPAGRRPVTDAEGQTGEWSGNKTVKPDWMKVPGGGGKEYYPAARTKPDGPAGVLEVIQLLKEGKWPITGKNGGLSLGMAQMAERVLEAMGNGEALDEMAHAFGSGLSIEDLKAGVYPGEDPEFFGDIDRLRQEGEIDEPGAMGAEPVQPTNVESLRNLLNWAPDSPQFRQAITAAAYPDLRAAYNSSLGKRTEPPRTAALLAELKRRANATQGGLFASSQTAASMPQGRRAPNRPQRDDLGPLFNQSAVPKGTQGRLFSEAIESAAPGAKPAIDWDAIRRITAQRKGGASGSPRPAPTPSAQEAPRPEGPEGPPPEGAGGPPAASGAPPAGEAGGAPSPAGSGIPAAEGRPGGQPEPGAPAGGPGEAGPGGEPAAPGGAVPRGVGDAERGGTGGGSYPRSSRQLVTIRPQFTHRIDEGAIPGDISQLLSPIQRQGVAKAWKSMHDVGGFLLFDGTGTGKTWQAMAVAKMYLTMEPGTKVLIVSDAASLKFTEGKTPRATGAWDEAGKGLKVELSVRKGVTGHELQPGVVNLASYQEMQKVVGVDKNTVILFDESHRLKNLAATKQSATAKAGAQLSEQAKAVMYASATPADQATHLAYMAKAGVFGDEDPGDVFERLGMINVRRRGFGGAPDQMVWEVNPAIGRPEMLRRMDELFSELTEKDIMVRREVTMKGSDIEFRTMPASPELTRLMTDIVKFYKGTETPDGGITGVTATQASRIRMAQRRQQEPFKVDEVIKGVSEELANGRQVVIYAERINPSDVGDWKPGPEGDKVWDILMGSEGTLKTIKDRLIADGIVGKDEIAEMHGNAREPADMARDRFNTGKAKVILMTPGSGAIGISLDDRIGDAPRSMYVVTASFQGDVAVQACGRICRMMTKSDSRYVFLFTDHPVDTWNKEILSKKMKLLGATVKGELRRLSEATKAEIDQEELDKGGGGDVGRRGREQQGAMPVEAPAASRRAPGRTVRPDEMDWGSRGGGPEEGAPGEQGAYAVPKYAPGTFRPAPSRLERRPGGGPARGAPVIPEDPTTGERMKEGVANAFKKIIETGDGFIKLFAPQARGPLAYEGERILRRRVGEERRQAAQYSKAWKAIYPEADRAPKADHYAAMFWIEQPDLRPAPTNPVLRQAAELFRQHLDTLREQVWDLGTRKLQTWYENYFTHLYKDPEAAQKWLRTRFNSTPWEGGKDWLHQRKWAFLEDSLAPKDQGGGGLRLKYDNMIDAMMAHEVELMKYISSHRTMDDYRKAGYAKFFRTSDQNARALQGLDAVDDNISEVFGPPNITVPESYDKLVREGLDTVMDSLDIAHERKVGIGGKRAGFYDPKTDKVTTRAFGPESVIEHELWHALDERYNLWDEMVEPNRGSKTKEDIALRKTLRAEASALADERFAGQEVTEGYKRYLHKKEEKIANLGAALMYAPELMERVAPTIKSRLIDFIKAHNELRPLLDIKPSLVLGQEHVDIPLGGPVKLGRWYLPEPIATVVNAYLKPGLRSGKLVGPAYNAYMNVANTLNNFQLIGAFHASFTTGETQASALATAVWNVAHGHLDEAMKNLVHWPVAPFDAATVGAKIRREYYEPGSQDPDIKYLADRFERIGGKIEMSPAYLTNHVEKWMKAIRRHNVTEGTLRLPFAVTEKAMEPVLKHLVPLQKLSVWAEMVKAYDHDLLDRSQREGWDSARLESERDKKHIDAWKITEERLGQMDYELMFIDHTVRDAMHATVRSVGWNWGTWKTILHGLKDTGQYTVDGAKWIKSGGETPAPDVTMRMAYLAAMPIMWAIYGSMMNWYMTGEKPGGKDGLNSITAMKDLFFPRTGRVDERGNPVRLFPPSYIKDIYHMVTDPKKTAANKLQPGLALIMEMLRNEDYYGTEIYGWDDNPEEIALALGKHAALAFLPFSARGLMRTRQLKGGIAEQALPLVGFLNAPLDIDATDAERYAHKAALLHRPVGSRTKEEGARIQKLSEVRRLILTKDSDARKTFDAAVQAGELRPRDWRSLQAKRGKSSLDLTIPHLSPAEAVEDYDRMSEAERKKEKPAVEKLLRTQGNRTNLPERTVARAKALGLKVNPRRAPGRPETAPEPDEAPAETPAAEPSEADQEFSILR